MRDDQKNLNDTDLLVHWAAEEFVAAGRVEDAERQELHRRRAAFFAEVFRALRAPAPEFPGPDRESGEVGALLQHAFGSCWRRR